MKKLPKRIKWTGKVWIITEDYENAFVIATPEQYATGEIGCSIIEYNRDDRTRDLLTLECNLQEPFSYEEPEEVLVNLHADLFHRPVPLDFIKWAFMVMNNTPQHTYHIKTKYPFQLERHFHELDWTSNIKLSVLVKDEMLLDSLHNLKTLPGVFSFTKRLPKYLISEDNY